MRYFAHIAYNGYNYSGWQRQSKVASIQGIVEDALTSLLKNRIIIIGCGRTDAKVHAAQYFFHFNANKELGMAHVEILNRITPEDITFYHLIKMQDHAHAQFDAVQRTYCYFMHFNPSPYLKGLSAYYHKADLDLAKMQEALNRLITYSDFSGLCKSPDKHSITECHLTHAQLYTNQDASQLYFTISGKRFLRGMIRIIAGKLLEIGKGKLTIAELENGVKHRRTPQFLNLAYPQGLYLSKIEYPHFDLPPKLDGAPLFGMTQWQKVRT